VGLIYLLLLAVAIIGSGFKWFSGGREGAEQLFAFATNPFMGLVMGSFATALVQSSSTVTSVIVALVAGGLPVSTAIPMVMGANIGTTVTNTLVSMGHVRDDDEFENAFSAATIHDFFNLLAVVIFLPLEYFTGILEKSSLWVAEKLTGSGNLDIGEFNFIKVLTKPVIELLGKEGLFAIFPGKLGGVLMAIFGVLLIFVAIFNLGKTLKKVMKGRAEELFHAAIGRGPLSGIASGTLITVFVQSSSTTTSLAVPLAGTGVLKLKEVYPFTLGANIGTCITAILAATAVTGAQAVYALEIAMAHFLYNVFGVIVIYGIPFLRNIPIYLAQMMARIAAKNKLLAIGYIATVFFIIPLICVGLYSALK
jgi:sodium-dependent phosphate cotransporter